MIKTIEWWDSTKNTINSNYKNRKEIPINNRMDIKLITKKCKTMRMSINIMSKTIMEMKVTMIIMTIEIIYEFYIIENELNIVL
jgi:collagenase-like PrtC family protease